MRWGGGKEVLFIIDHSSSIDQGLLKIKWLVNFIVHHNFTDVVLRDPGSIKFSYIL